MEVCRYHHTISNNKWMNGLMNKNEMEWLCKQIEKEKSKKVKRVNVSYDNIICMPQCYHMPCIKK